MTAPLPTAHATPWPKSRVLVVDDDPIVAAGYERVLRRAGFQVDVAMSGEEAVNAFAQGRYHTIISDISMPGMTGLELVRAIRHHDLDTPVVLITGAPSIETAIEAMDQGAMRYLVKPVSGDELTSVVEQAINLYRMAVVKRRALDLLGGADRQIGDRAGLEVKFEAALDQIFLAYQPIVRWSVREVAGYEALVRSREPTIPHPGALFDAAERLGRIAELSHRIRALAPLPFLAKEKQGSPSLFLNLHVRDLLDESIFDTEAPLARIADRVVLEITERSALEEVKDARARIARLREIGFRVAVDDLGAGYAGLNSFAQLEPDVVKLDMTLVRDIHLAPTKRKLVRSMVVLCRDMGMEVVAEGIENTDERDCVIDLGCDLLQGFLFGRPAAPFADVTW